MPRLLVVFVVATLIWAVDVQPLLAAAADDQNWPTLGTQFNRARGAYLSPW